MSRDQNAGQSHNIKIDNSSNQLKHWYVRHNNLYCFHLWATCFNLYTGYLQALLYM